MKPFLSQAGRVVRECAGTGWLFALWLLTCAPTVQAQEITTVLVAPSVPPHSGGECAVWLYCLNESSHPVRQTFPPSLPGTLTSVAGRVPILLSLNPGGQGDPVPIAPGGFVKAEYGLEIPAALAGQVTLAVSNCNQLVIPLASDTPRALATLATTPATALPAATNSPPPLAYVQYLGDHLSAYEPIYFILGTYPAAEFQFSIKYKLFDLTNTRNPLAHLYFAYTQTSFWDLISQDPSFYDTSYKPSAFLVYHNVLHQGIFRLDLQPGMEHESNGHGGAGERSLYTGYLQPTATFDLPQNLQFTLQPRVWEYFDVGNNNPDIASYRGYGDLRAALTWTDPNSSEKIQFAAKLETGDEGRHDGYQFDLRFNLAGVPYLDKFNPSIQVQYFTGYGQTLRQYNQSSHGLRAGICLWY